MIRGRKTFFDVDIDSEYVATRTYTHRPNPKVDAMCEHAWIILMKYRRDGLTITSLLSRIRYDGYRVSDQIDITMEKRGYLLWMDGNKLKPFRHVSGVYVEYDDVEVDRQIGLGLAGVE